VLTADLPAPVAPEPPPSPTFTAEQQHYLDKTLIPRVMGRSAADVRKNLELARAKISELEVTLKAARPDSTESDRLRSELQAATLEVQSIKAISAETQKNADLDRAAVRHNFLDAELTRKITSERVQSKDGVYQILDDHGNVRVDTAGTPISLDAYYAEVAAARPYLVKGSIISGHNTQPSNGARGPAQVDIRRYFGPTSSASAANKLPPAEYRRLRVEAVRQGLVQ